MLLRVALHDRAEVRTVGGLAEVYEHVGDAAAEALRAILEPRPGLDVRVRAAAIDPALDDDRVANLLYYLGPGYEPLRRELEVSDEARLRLRAARAVLSFRRTREMSARLLADPAPELRIEGLDVPRDALDLDTCLRLLREDPSALVRSRAARTLRYTAVESAPFLAAARVERDPGVRAMLLSCLAHRRRDRATIVAIIGFLAEPETPTRRAAAKALSGVDDRTVASAIALRVLDEPDWYVWTVLLRHTRLLTRVPELRAPLDRLARSTVPDGERHALAAALASSADASRPPAVDGERHAPVAALASPADPSAVDGLDASQRARLLIAVIRRTVATLAPGVARSEDHGEAQALDTLRRWLAEPGEGIEGLLRAELEVEENLWHTDPHASKVEAAWDCVRAALSGDLLYALRIGVDAAVQAARRDEPARDPVAAAELTRLAHLLTADLVRAGVDPPPGTISRRLLADDHPPVGDHRPVDGASDSAETLAVWLSDGRVVQLAPGGPVPHSTRARPERAARAVMCARCGHRHQVEGPVAFAYVDDDRVSEAELGFAGVLVGVCPECATPAREEPRLTLTRSRADGSGTLVWEAGAG